MPERPNIIFIMPDQLRADFLSCYGAAFIETPHIDSLAENGVIYTRAYSPHPVCVPARIALMTGMDAIKNGVLDNGQTLRPDHRACGIETWPKILSDSGYSPIAVGKMHFYPWEARWGFRQRIIAEDKHWQFIEDDYYHFLRAHGYKKSIGLDRPEFHSQFMTYLSDIPWELSVDHFTGHEAARWIRKYEGEEPFAMMVGFPGPHSPYDPTPEYAARFWSFEAEHEAEHHPPQRRSGIDERGIRGAGKANPVGEDHVVEADADRTEESHGHEIPGFYPPFGLQELEYSQQHHSGQGEPQSHER